MACRCDGAVSSADHGTGRTREERIVGPLDRTVGQNQRVIGTDSWHLVFVPISIRFGTHAQQVFYEALAARLAPIAGRTCHAPAADAAYFYADTVRDLIKDLSGSPGRILLIIDGLDEALRGEFDATIFPRLLAPTFRIVVSARWQAGDVDSSGWRRRLDWGLDLGCATRELNTLDSAATADVLVRMGAPVARVAADAALLTRLAELTEGEPLVLRFYAMDLWGKGDGVRRLGRADLDWSKTRGSAPISIDGWRTRRRPRARLGEQVDRWNVDAVLGVLVFRLT